MTEGTIEVKLPHPFQLPNGETAEVAVIGLLTLRERMELKKKFPSEKHFDDRVIWLAEKRLVRLGSLDAPIDREVILSMPTSDFDYLLEAMWALDAGYTSVDDFRASEEYRQYTGAI